MLDDLPNGTEVEILTDNQALVKALENKESNSESVHKSKADLNTRGQTLDLKINWIKAHNNYEGNELADLLAKDGAAGLGNGPLVTTKIARKVANTKIKRYIENEWNIRWRNGKDARQTKIFFPKIDLSKSQQITKLSRVTLGKVIRAISGHDFRKRHEGLMKGITTSNCRFCGNEEETSSHVINQCPRLAKKRMDYFRTPMGTEVNPTWKPEQLAAFLSDPTISEMEVPEWEY